MTDRGNYADTGNDDAPFFLVRLLHSLGFLSRHGFVFTSQGDFSAFVVHMQSIAANRVPYLVLFLQVLGLRLRDLRNMDQSLKAVIQFHKETEIHDPCG